MPALPAQGSVQMLFRFLIGFLSGLLRGMKALSSGFYYNWGVTYARWGQPSKAMYYFNRAVQLNTDGAQVHYQRGLLFIAMGQPLAAIRDFDVAIGSDPKHLDAYLNRSIMHALNGSHEHAQQDVDSAVALGADRLSLESQIAALREQTG